MTMPADLIVYAWVCSEARLVIKKGITCKFSTVLLDKVFVLLF
jgi:hypothetical protein